MRMRLAPVSPTIVPVVSVSEPARQHDTNSNIGSSTVLDSVAGWYYYSTYYY